MNNYDEEIAERIKIARQRKGLGQKKLAELVGVSTASIGGYETCKSYPRLEVLIKIGEVCEVSLDWLTKGDTPLPRIGVESEIPLLQKIQLMEESFHKKEEQYLEIIRNLSLGKAKVVEQIATVIERMTGSMTHQRGLLRMQLTD